jgi:hypothetical protein
MINFLFDKIEYSDWIILLFGFFLSILWSIFIFKLRPKLYINKPEIGKNPKAHLIIPIENKSLFFSSNKISIEVALLIENEFTYHFDMDFKDFILIPTACNTESIRKFKSYNPLPLTQELYNVTIDDLLKYLKSNDSKIRVRVHAYHELTGLGKSFEQKFKFENNDFIKINS